MTEKDVADFKDARERAALGSPTKITGSSSAISAVCTPSTSTSSAPSSQPRCPAAIQFGQWEIETWYSSPFPQEYAR